MSLSGDSDEAPTVDVSTPATSPVSPVQARVRSNPAGGSTLDETLGGAWLPVSSGSLPPTTSATPSASFFAVPATPSASFFAISSPRLGRHHPPPALGVVAEGGGDGGEDDDDDDDDDGDSAAAAALALAPLPVPMPAPAPVRTTPRGANNVRRHLRVPSAASAVVMSGDEGLADGGE